MRVTLLSKALVVGAYQRKCELIAAHPDVKLTVLVPPAWGNQALERLYTAGYDLRVIPCRFNGNFHLHHYPTLARELQKSQPDVLHIDEEPYNLATWLAVKAAGSHQSKGARPHVVFFSWQNINRHYPFPFALFEREVLRKTDAAMVGSHEAEQVWRAKGYTRSIDVIPQFGVDETHFSPLKQDGTDRPAGDGFVLGYAGRLEFAKGVDVLLRALPELPANTRLVIAGTGGAERELRTLATQLGTLSRITWRGGIASADMPRFYHALDALVLPSRTLPNWKEQFGRVLIEAMACGVPVVGARSGEIPNVLGDAGLLFGEGDVAGLSAQLRRLIEQSQLRDALSRMGRARVLERYSMQHIADQTVTAYRAVGR